MAARRNNRSRSKAVEAAAEVEGDNQGSSMTIDDGMQIFTFVALVGAVLIVWLTLLPRYA